MKPHWVILLISAVGLAQSYPPEAGLPGSTAIHKDSPLFVAWATGITVTRGHVNIANPEFETAGSNYASSGQPDYATGYADGNTVSLGDGGSAILTFANPIKNESGFDFAVFENGSSTYLELAFVEVSSNGIDFFRFPNHSETQTETQLGPFGSPSASYLNNLAGKYEAVYGTPFDLSDLPDNTLLDKENITHVKIIDVVGSISPLYASYDSFGNAVNEPYPTPFSSCGFDLQAVGVIHQQSLETGHLDRLQNLFVYPNPAKNHLYFSDEVSTVRIADTSGRIVLTARNVINDGIDVSNLSSGMYVILATDQHQFKVLPLLIQ